jgi:hypothetical protein
MGLGEFLSGAGDWLGRNWGTISKVGTAAKNVYSAYDQNKSQQQARSGIYDIMEQQLLAQQAQKQQMLDYYNANAGAGGGGGRSRGPSISPAAMAAEQKAQQAAAKKAMQTQKKYLGQMSKMYSPYIEASKTLVPAQTANYKGFLDTTGMLNQYLSNAAMKTFQEPQQNLWDMKVPDAAYKVATPQSNVQIPNLTELLKRG